LPLLETHEVVVRFGGVLAVDHASLAVEAGAVTGLIGPNGAGKTTLFNVITGLQPPTEGRVSLDGADITKLTTQRRAHRGVGRTFQRLEVFGSLTVRENIMVAAEIREQWADDTDEQPADTADRLLDLIGITTFAHQLADSVPTGIARLTELGRALAIRPRVLLLDEPSSGLTEEETQDFAVLLRTLAREGLGVLIVEHDMDLVMDVCQTIHVLDFGRVIASGDPAAVQADPAVQAAYLGVEVEAADEEVVA
jgi:branched-chain amino acid transport system ATP-binding protein